MRITLIFPYYSQIIPGSFMQKIRGKYPCLGLVYIAGALEQAGHQVQFIDAEAEDLSFMEINKRIKKFQPQLVGLNSTTGTFSVVRETAQAIKKEFPEIKIIVGGPQVIVFPEISLEFPEIDFGIVGEGEHSMPMLAQALQHNNTDEFKKIPGLVYRQNGKILINLSPEPIRDLDILPLPAWHLLPINKYTDIIAIKKNYITMITSRGCPFNCLFCDARARLGRSFRMHSANYIVSQMVYLKENFNIQEICFYDDTFTANRKRILDLCNLLIKKRLDIIWECRTRVDTVDEELLKKMHQAGCYRIRFGVESGNNEILKFIRKGITKDQVRKAFKLARKAGIEPAAYFMLGHPNETETTLKETIDFALEIDPSYVNFNRVSLSPPGCDLFKWGVEHGHIEADYWEKIVRGEKMHTPFFVTKEVPEDMINKYYKLAHRKLYFRPKFFLRALKYLSSFDVLKKYTIAFWAIFKNTILPSKEKIAA